jgi:hypothetical protein
MISNTETELIKAYFEGGNAKDVPAHFLKEILETIKEAAQESKIKPEDRTAKVFHPEPHQYGNNAR